MRIVRVAVLCAFVLVLGAVPAAGAEQLTRVCPVCDHVDVAGSVREPNATLILTITDVKSGQTVPPKTQVTTNSSGNFSCEFDMDLAKHPSLLGNPSSRASPGPGRPYEGQRPGPLPAGRLPPYTGSHTGPVAGTAGALLAVGGLLLLVSRRRSGSTPA